MFIMRYFKALTRFAGRAAAGDVGYRNHARTRAQSWPPGANDYRTGRSSNSCVCPPACANKQQLDSVVNAAAAVETTDEDDVAEQARHSPALRITSSKAVP
jgi:hypothetical protein